tara:strand:+ start:141 stop:710 length:570 start_codon:yes stop_codon:yes gene_type:complete
MDVFSNHCDLIEGDIENDLFSLCSEFPEFNEIQKDEIDIQNFEIEHFDSWEPTNIDDINIYMDETKNELSDNRNCEPLKKKNKKSKTIIRSNFYRKVDTLQNERLRAALYLYRFTDLKLGYLKSLFKIPVKTLMRYVDRSCEKKFEKFNLFLGCKGIVSNDRALLKSERSKKQQLPNIEIPSLALQIVI